MQPAYGTLFFDNGNNGQTTMTDDNITSMNGLRWDGTQSWTLNQGGSTVLSLFDFSGTQAKIESQTTGLVTINLPIIFAATGGNNWGEINAVSGNISFGTGTLTVNGSGVAGIRMFGAGHTTTFNNTVAAGTKYFDTASTTAQTVTVSGAFTSGDFYLMNGSTLNDGSTGTNFAAATLRLGGDFGISGNQNLALGATFNMTVATGGQTYAGTINPVSGNTSNALLIQSLNTSGTNTLSGNFFLDSNLKIAVSAASSTGALLLGAAGSTNTISFQNVGSRALTLAPGVSASSITVNESFTNVLDGSDALITTGGANGSTTTINSNNSAASSNLLLFNPQSGTLAISSASNLGTPVVGGSGYPDKVLFGGSGAGTTATLLINGTFSYGSATAGQLLGFAVNRGTSANTAIINVAPTFTLTMNGALSDFGTGTAGNWQKDGTGTLILTANSAYTGSTTINSGGGTLAGTVANAFGSTSSITISGTGTTLSLRGDTSTAFVKASDSTPYSLVAGSGAIINVDQATGAGTGAKTMTTGTLGTNSTSAGFAMSFTGGNNTSLSLGAVTGPASTAIATPTYTNSISGGGMLTWASFTGANASGGDTLTFNGTGKTVITGAITPGSGGLALKENAAGTLTLSGASTYAGGTTVSGGGNLFVNNTIGSGTGSGPVAVSGTGSLLGGSGTITGAVSIAGTPSSLAPGATGVGSTAVLHTGALTLSSGSNYFVDLNSAILGTGYDQTSVTGMVTVSGSRLTVTLGAGFTPTNQNFIIVSNDLTDPVSGTFSANSVIPSGYTIDYFYDDVTNSLTGGNDIAIVPVPEPSTWAAGILTVAALGFSQRRRVSRLFKLA